ncbi:MAG TPA: hypothetical protein VMN35_08375 [Gaiellaceae bacterium]|nr:hypothetical protein [Gaiellaceae bacterium]
MTIEIPEEEESKAAVELIEGGSELAGALVGSALGLVGGPAGVAAGAVGGGRGDAWAQESFVSTSPEAEG